MPMKPIVPLLGFAAAALGGCSMATRPAQPAVMATARVTMPPERLRMRAVEAARDVAGIVELAADDILEESADPAVRRNALLWKANAIPAIQTAVVQFDPLVAFFDLFALCVQMDDFVRTGAGRDAFGPHQGRAVQGAADALESMRRLARAVAADSAGAERAEGIATDWAREHPVASVAFARPTMRSVAADFVGWTDPGALASVGRMEQSVTDLNTRVAMLMAYLPKQIRWETQMLAEELLGGERIDTALADVGSLARSVDRLAAVAESVPGLADWQRRAIMEAVTAERVAVMRGITAERTAAFESVAEQITRLLAAITEERAAAMRDAEDMLVRTVQQSQASVDAAIDHLVWRLAQLAAVLVVAGTVALGIAVFVLRRAGTPLFAGPRP